MIPLRKLLGRLGPVLLIVAVHGALLTAPRVAAIEVAPPPADLEKAYASITTPVAVTVSPGGIGRVTTALCGNPRWIFTFTSLPGQRPRQFKRLPNLPPGVECYEHQIVVSPAVADVTAPQAVGFPTPGPTGDPSHEFLVTIPGLPPAGDSSGTGPRIVRIALNRAALRRGRVQYNDPVLFATLPTTCARNQTVGLTYDKTQNGAWGNTLLAACTLGTGFGGEVFSISKDGRVTNVAHILGFRGPFTHMDVALTGPLAGQLFIPAMNAGSECGSPGNPCGLVLRVSPPILREGGGIQTATPHASVPSVKALSFIADKKCNFGSPNRIAPDSAKYFKSKFPSGTGGNRIDFIPGSPFDPFPLQFAALSQNGEGGVGVWTVSQAPGAAAPFSGTDSTSTRLDAAFVECLDPSIVQVRILGRGTGILTVILSANRDQVDLSKADFPGSILTRIDQPVQDSANHPIGPCTRGEDDQDRGKARGRNNDEDDDRFKARRAGNDEDENDDENGNNTFTCRFAEPPGPSNQFLAWKANVPGGDGDEGGI